MTVGEVSYDNTINLWYVMHNIKWIWIGNWLRNW
jgi:hypothetical protein